MPWVVEHGNFQGSGSWPEIDEGLLSETVVASHVADRRKGTPLKQ